MTKVNIINSDIIDGETVTRERADCEYEGNPTVTLSDGVEYTYHPYGINSPQLLGNQLNHERQAESDEAWLASCSPAARAAVEAVAYKDKRKAEYPDIGDQLDALWKNYNGDSTDADLIKAQIDAVKTKYPK
tara:strand:+ start:938 stop:1333 length:396 start_codon:yes stop_codon:yes gene_type:complete